MMSLQGKTILITGAAGQFSGLSLLDEEALQRAGIHDFSQYACTPGNEDQLAKDLFVD